ncbi:MAG: hypothetical protein R2747_10555 [Pyrinomonadaceae bacterium]
MLRAIVLSLALLIGIGTIIPLATEFAEAGSRKHRKYKKKKVKRYSKRWWRAYNKQKQVKRAKAKRKKRARVRRARRSRIRRARAARLRRARLARVRRAHRAKTRRTAAKRRTYSRSRSKAKRSARRTSGSRVVAQRQMTSTPVPTVLPSGNPAPKSWKSEGVVQGELQFTVKDNSGSQLGSAAIAVVGPAVNDAPVYNSRVKTVGGVATTSLRRTVIDEMIRENGWVVNDYQKEVAGQKVYVVVAQAPGSNNQVENRMYYFTEVEGKIYSVATKAPDKASDRLEEESEKVIVSLQRRSAPTTQVASNRTVSNLVANEE